MALKDLDEDKHYWYYNASRLNDLEDSTVVDFEESNGKVKTGEMLQKYEDQEYGEPKTNGTYTDLWGLATLKEKVVKGWFVPSRAEWAAFGDMLSTSEYLPEKVTNSNYKNYGLKDWYWSSSPTIYSNAWVAYYYAVYMTTFLANNVAYVRLSATF